MVDLVLVGHVRCVAGVGVSFLAPVHAEGHRVHDGVVFVRRSGHAIQGDVAALGRDKGSLRPFGRRDGTVIASRR